MTERRGTSPWIYVGLGCLISVLVVVGVVASIAVWGYRVRRENLDPIARTARAHEVLGTSELPNGYHAVISISVPIVLDMAILSDRPPGNDGRFRGFGRRGFIYIRSLGRGQNREELKDYFEGKTDDPGILRRNRIQFRPREIIKRGVLELPGETLLYMAQRSEGAFQGSPFRGVSALMLVECPGDDSRRLGIWFGPDPDPDKPAASVDFAGTPADESAIREFMGRFKVCGS